MELLFIILALLLLCLAFIIDLYRRDNVAIKQLKECNTKLKLIAGDSDMVWGGKISDLNRDIHNLREVPRQIKYLEDYLGVKFVIQEQRENGLIKDSFVGYKKIGKSK